MEIIARDDSGDPTHSQILELTIFNKATGSTLSIDPTGLGQMPHSSASSLVCLIVAFSEIIKGQPYVLTPLVTPLISSADIDSLVEDFDCFSRKGRLAAWSGCQWFLAPDHERNQENKTIFSTNSTLISHQERGCLIRFVNSLRKIAKSDPEIFKLLMEKIEVIHTQKSFLEQFYGDL